MIIPKNLRWVWLVVFLLTFGMLLAACQPQPVAEEEPTEEEMTEEPAEEEMTEEAPAEEETPEEEPTEEAEAEPEVRYCADGLEGETITWYAQAGLTGPLSTILGTSFVNAINDATAEINADGGVCGAELVIDLADTQYDTEQEIERYNVIREADPAPIFITTYGSGATIALAELVSEDQVVNIAAGLNAEAFYNPPNGYTVGVAPIYSDQFAGFVEWAVNNWDDIKPEGAGDEVVVGVIGWEGPFGAGATTPEAIAYAESVGATVLELQTQAVSAEADVVTPLQTLVSQGANVIYIQSLGFGPAQVIGGLRTTGLWDSVVVGGVNWAINTDVLNFLGESAPAAVGMYGVVPYAWWNDTDNEGVQQALAAFEAGGYPPEDLAVSYLTSYAGAFATRDILEHAIDMVGYENLDGAAFLAAMEDLGTVSALGVFEFNVENGNRAPNMATIRQVQVVDDELQFVIVEDWFELPDTRPSAE